MLTEEEAATLREHYTKGSMAAAAKVLREAYERCLWVACGCRAKNGVPPLMYPRLTLRNQLVLQNIRDRLSHDTSCPFGRIKAPPLEHLLQQDTMPRLATLLFQWIETARLNVVLPEYFDERTDFQWRSLREAAKQISFAPGRTLYDYSRTRAIGLPALELKLRNDALRGIGASEGFLLNWIERADLQSWRQALVEGYLEGDADRYGAPAIWSVPHCDSAVGPFITITRFQYDERLQQMIAQEVFAHPVYSKTLLFPTGTQHERRTLAKLLDELQHRAVPLQLHAALPISSAYTRGHRLRVAVMRPNSLVEASFQVATVGDVPGWSTNPVSDAIYHFTSHPHGERFLGQVHERVSRILCADENTAAHDELQASTAVGVQI